MYNHPNNFSGMIQRRTQPDIFLPPEQEAQYKLWAQSLAAKNPNFSDVLQFGSLNPASSGRDYDYRTAYLQNLAAGTNGHLGDAGKKPNHMTFSNESLYAKYAPKRAGQWLGFGDGSMYLPNSDQGLNNEYTQRIGYQ